MKDDAQLIDATLAGESAAFGCLVTKYQDRLVNTLVPLLGSAEDARDVAQDAFVQAFVKLDRFRRTSAFYTWLYRIAFNMAMSHRRRKKPTVSLEEIKERTGTEPTEDGCDPGDRLLRDEQVCQVQAALATLAEDHRVVLVLREIDGCRYETIAEILDLPVGTIRSRLHRARIQLREQLQQILHEKP